MSQCYSLRGGATTKTAPLGPNPQGRWRFWTADAKWPLFDWTAKGFSNRPFPAGTSIGEGNFISETGH